MLVRVRVRVRVVSRIAPRCPNISRDVAQLSDVVFGASSNVQGDDPHWCSQRSPDRANFDCLLPPHRQSHETFMRQSQRLPLVSMPFLSRWSACFPPPQPGHERVCQPCWSPHCRGDVSRRHGRGCSRVTWTPCPSPRIGHGLAPLWARGMAVRPGLELLHTWHVFPASRSKDVGCLSDTQLAVCAGGNLFASDRYLCREAFAAWRTVWLGLLAALAAFFSERPRRSPSASGGGLASCGGSRKFAETKQIDGASSFQRRSPTFIHHPVCTRARKHIT